MNIILKQRFRHQKTTTITTITTTMPFKMQVVNNQAPTLKYISR
jgi:hypothetical protein